MTSLEVRARSIVAEAVSKLAPLEYIKREVAALDPAEVQSLAVAYLHAQLKARKRAAVREVEQSSTRAPEWQRVPAEPTLGTQSWERWAKKTNPSDERWAEHHAQLAEWERKDAELLAEMHRKMNDALQKFTDEMKVQWTDELLRSELALGDGTVTTWGQATREQHQARMAMHKRNATAGMEGYARHAAAVAELETTGATCLNQAVVQLAVGAQ